MRVSKFLGIISFVTAFSLLYVYQQTEILHIAYACEKNLNIVEELQDKNSLLKYNIAKGASLTQLGNIVSKTDSSFQMPDRLLKLAGRKHGIVAGTPVSKTRKESLLSRIFSIKRQAEARTIKP